MRTHPTAGRLNLEWAELEGLPAPPHWSALAPLLPSASLGDVLASIRSDPDGVLGALLQVRDAAAQRVVLQAMLGWAVRAAARDLARDLDDYLGELWLGIATYPLNRRPTSIAANLALDARKRVWARPRWDPVDPELLNRLPPAPAGRGVSASLLLARARRARLIDEFSDRALRLVYAQGLATAEAAAILKVSPTALRQRCHRALRRLADHAAELGEIVG